MKGSIKQRDNGKYLARYTAPDGHERSHTFRRKTDAKNWLSTQTADLARGEWTDPKLGRMTFAEWVKQWEKTLHHLKPTSKTQELKIVRNHLLPRFGDYPLKSITPARVKQMVTDNVAAGYAAETIQKHLTVLQKILGAAIADGRLSQNPCSKVKGPRRDTPRQRFLSPEQVRDLAEAISPDYYRTFVYCAAYLGLRFGELAGLEVGSVDPLRRTVDVTQQATESNGKTIWQSPKTKSSIRTITMPKWIAEMVAEHLATEQVQTSGLAFPNFHGRVMRTAVFNRRWREAVNKVFAGTELEGLVLHELRHTAASLAIASGAPLIFIRDRMGHANIAQTMDTYGHLYPDYDEPIADELDAMARRAQSEAPNMDQTRTSGGSVTSLTRS
jgi:integrase